MKGSCTMPSANGKGAVYIEKILDEELGDKCALYAKVTIPAGSVLGYHEHHGNGETSAPATAPGRRTAPATASTTPMAPKTSSSSRSSSTNSRAATSAWT